ncbi:MAG: hypothetical protein AAF236_00775 [Verrucomicrobiota bacterium]
MTKEINQPPETPVEAPLGECLAPPSRLDLAAEVAELSIENKRYATALRKIAKWFGEFPSSGRTWDNGEEMSYGAAFGSKGERDFMRKVASEALERH